MELMRPTESPNTLFILWILSYFLIKVKNMINKTVIYIGI